MKRNKGLIGVIVALVIAMLGVACAAEKVKPAEFRITDLTVTPSEVKIGEPVTVKVKVTNAGEKQGTHTLELFVEGEVEAREPLTLSGGEERMVSFTVKRKEPKTYTVRIANLSQPFKVKAPQELTVKIGEVKVRKGGTGQVEVVLHKVEKGFSGGKMSVSLEDVSIGEISKVTFPDFGLTDVSDLPASSVTFKVVDLKDIIPPKTEKAKLATIEVKGQKSGSTSIQISIEAMDNDEGNPMEPRIIPGYLEVK